jgi:hypothetical protein
MPNHVKNTTRKQMQLEPGERTENSQRGAFTSCYLRLRSNILTPEITANPMGLFLRGEKS